MPLVTYIATDERNASTLKYLLSHDFKLFNNLRDDREVISAVNLLHVNNSKANSTLPAALNSSINAVDAFVLELMLMINSTYFFAWGGKPLAS